MLAALLALLFYFIVPFGEFPTDSVFWGAADEAHNDAKHLLLGNAGAIFGAAFKSEDIFVFDNPKTINPPVVRHCDSAKLGWSNLLEATGCASDWHSGVNYRPTWWVFTGKIEIWPPFGKRMTKDHYATELSNITSRSFPVIGNLDFDGGDQPGPKIFKVKWRSRNIRPQFTSAAVSRVPQRSLGYQPKSTGGNKQKSREDSQRVIGSVDRAEEDIPPGFMFFPRAIAGGLGLIFTVAAIRYWRKKDLVSSICYVANAALFWIFCYGVEPLQRLFYSALILLDGAFGL